jgi:transcriptional regulator with XRE-family HTH domain
MTIGNRIQQQREAAGMGIYDLAKALECSRNQIRAYEYGNVQPSPEEIVRIAKALGCQPEDLAENSPQATEPTEPSYGSDIIRVVSDKDCSPEALQKLRTVWSDLFNPEIKSEAWYVWREYKHKAGETKPRLHVPQSDSAEYGWAMDTLFKTSAEAVEAKAELAPDEDWYLVLQINRVIQRFQPSEVEITPSPVDDLQPKPEDDNDQQK